MPWRLKVWFGYCSNTNGDAFDSPAIDEEVASKAAGKARALEILADGHTSESASEYHHFPAASISHMKLYEYEEEE